jgi:hypothetical protein
MDNWLSVAILIILAGCTPVPPQATAAATSSPAAVEKTATLSPTETPSPEVRPTITFLPGLTPLEHPGFPGIVFLVDTRRWTNDFNPHGPLADRNKFLHYNTLPACRLEAVPDTKLAVPDQIDGVAMRGRFFHMYKYAGFSIYETSRIYFKLAGLNNLECHTVLETLLADSVDAGEFYGGAAAPPLATRGPDTVTGFTCDALPPLLRPGNTAYIGTSGVWLRSSPEVGPYNTIKLFPKHAPVLVSILDGPRCASGYVYWQVTVNPIGAGGGPYSGWMAESNAQKYILRNWNP